ncbi:hypothetical protein NBZ79_07395 [Sneathiella marina]|uniref:Lipoprotein n=1 Tax=Sneathiella marina TaxID=2950108 RepID=A0ABY4W9J3_9PROT|nr:hypothetical protein [Sneathiella marina]USG62798.1 hypothetical protein NBZ79_07395 [Sneathiella marina]
MHRILALCIFTLILGGCAENKWQFSDASKSIVSKPMDGLASRELKKNTGVAARFQGFSYEKIAMFVENAEQRKTEIVPVKSGEHITLKFAKSYISAGNHLCKLFEFSQFKEMEEQQFSEYVFCYLNDRWELLAPLSYREGQREIFNALKVAFILQEDP